MHATQLWAPGGADRPGAGGRGQGAGRPLRLPSHTVELSQLGAGRKGAREEPGRIRLVTESFISAFGTRSGKGKVFVESKNAVHLFIQQTHADPFAVPGSVFRSETHRCQPRASAEGFHTRRCHLSGVLPGGQELARQRRETGAFQAGKVAVPGQGGHGCPGKARMQRECGRKTGQAATVLPHQVTMCHHCVSDTSAAFGSQDRACPLVSLAPFSPEQGLNLWGRR